MCQSIRKRRNTGWNKEGLFLKNEKQLLLLLNSSFRFLFLLTFWLQLQHAAATLTNFNRLDGATMLLVAKMRFACILHSFSRRSSPPSSIPLFSRYTHLCTSSMKTRVTGF